MYLTLLVEKLKITETFLDAYVNFWEAFIRLWHFQNDTRSFFWHF